MTKKSKRIVKQIKRESDSKTATATNFQFDKFVLDDREYSKEEVLEILKKHKAEEDAKYITCERCAKRYLDNNKFNIVKYDLLDEQPEGVYGSGYAHVYMTTPYIKGFQISTNCGRGKEIKLCDDCIESLLDWLKEYKV